MYGVAEAECLWLAHYGQPARARRIASELDAVFRISETDGGTYLLRIADNGQGVVDLQVALLEHIAATDAALPVPRIRRSRTGESVIALPSAASGALAAFATSFLPGRPLATLAPSRALRCRVIALLSLLDRSLETFAHPRATRTLLWDVSSADRIRPLVVSVADPELRELAGHAIDDWISHAAPVLPSLRRQVIHNDFNPSNLLVADDGMITGIIDFGDAIAAPLVCDLATAIAYQVPKDGFDALLSSSIEAFSHACPLTAPELASLPVLVRARAAMVVAIAHWRAAQNPAHRAYLLRNVPLAACVLKAAKASGKAR